MLTGLAAAASAQPAMTAAFTYQGQLKLDDYPVNEPADFEFRLWTAASGGAVVSPVLTRNNVEVTNGLFTVTLDFGANAFAGDVRWLEVSVRSPAGIGGFTPLTPRQIVTATPYAATALQALNVPGIDGHSLDAADGSPANAVFVNNVGNVGIGTTSPTSTLHVNGTAAATAFAAGSGGLSIREGDLALLTSDNADDQSIFFRNSGGAYTWRIYREDAGALQANLHIAGGASSQDYTTLRNFLTMKNSGNVGIGTETPQAALHIKRDPPYPGGTLALEGETHTYMSFFPQGFDKGRMAWIGYPVGYAEDLWVTNQINGNINLMTDGNVGIGTSVPQDKLDVAGIVRAQGVRLVGGADIAEPFHVGPGVDVRPGMVVAIDPTKPGHLRISDRDYDTRVAGIVSGANGINPGMTLAQSGTIADGEHPVALSGRVWCLVDADANGPVKPGDMLTTSATTGHAMKATDRARAVGATIGKAMTSLEQGKGLVLVLVNLQ